MRGFPGQLGVGFGSGAVATPVPTSDNPSVVAKQTLREMLARSETFQDAIGATGTLAQKIAAAKARIYLSAYISDSMTRPFAVICKNETDKRSAIGGGEGQQFISGGSQEVRFEKIIPDEFLNEQESDIAEGKEGDAENNFEEFYEGCITDVNALAGTEGYLFIRNWDTIEGPKLFESAGNQQNVYAIRKSCNWGIE